MGQFSWFAQDTKKQIFNDYERHPIHMVDPRDGTDYLEEHYEGYGVFGGRDFYELFADLNKDFIYRYELSFSYLCLDSKTEYDKLLTIIKEFRNEIDKLDVKKESICNAF